MKILINEKDNLPIFLQIVRGIEAHILAGHLKEDEFLPSVREFSVAHKINPNTVARAYQTLQSEGWAESLRGQGLVVRLKNNRAVDARKDALVSEALQAAIEKAKAIGVEKKELQKTFNDLLEKTFERKGGGKL